MIPSTRFEYKFRLTVAQRATLFADFAAHLQPDTAGSPTGHYPVVSLYYDTPQLDSHWDAWRGLPVRRKLRLRVYGTADGATPPVCFLEIKHKDGAEDAKRRLRLSLAEALRAGRGEAISVAPGDASTLAEIARLIQAGNLRPTCIMRYDRQALLLQDSTMASPLRVTFDQNIKVRFTQLIPAPEDPGCTLPVLAGEECLLELKGSGAVPYALAQALSARGIYPRPFSKYSEAVRRHHPARLTIA